MIPAWFIFIFSAYLLHSISTTFDKYLLSTFHSRTFGFFKIGTNALLLLIIVLLFFIKDIGSITNWIYYLLIMGFLYALGTVLYMFAMKRGAVSELVPYDFSLAIVVAFFTAAIIFSEPISSINIIGVFLIFAGIWLILAKKGHIIPKFSLPLLIMTLHFIVIVAYQMVAKYVSININPFVISFSMYLTCSVFLIIFALIFLREQFARNLKLFKTKRKNIIWLLLGSATAVFGTTFIYKALSLGAATKVLPVSGILPFFMVLFGGAFFKEKNIMQKIIGAVLIFGGIYLIAV